VAKKPLTPKQEKFCRGIVAGLNQSDAYRKAYNTKNMKDKSIHANAHILMLHTEIAQRIKNLSVPILKQLTMSRVEWLRINEQMMRHDLRRTLGAEGTIKPIQDWEDNEVMALAGIERRVIYLGKGKDRKEVGSITKFKMIDRTKPSEIIGKAQGFYRDEEDDSTTSKVPPRVEVVFVDAANVQVNVGPRTARPKPKVEFVG
jgi:phage terminase small subunit